MSTSLTTSVTQTTLDTTADSTTDAETTAMETSSSEAGSSSSDASSSESSSESGDLCGNDVIDPGETCDGSDLGGADCVSQGFDGGTLGCAADCSALDESACTMADCGNGAIEGRELCDGADLGGADCVSEGFDGGTLGCSPNCSVYNFAGCANCGDNNQGGNEACDGIDFNGESCMTQGFQGGTLSCSADCTTIDTSNCNDEPPCAEEDLGSAVGDGVATGTTVGEDEDLAQACASGGSVDHVLRWVAPADGTYRFDTVDSDYDTALAIYTDCFSAEVQCNDDVGFNSLRDSRIVMDVTAGDLLLISVNGYGGATGNWILNINVDVPGSGACCNAHGTYGCDDDDGSCDDTVCALNPDCCNPAGVWTNDCVALAVDNCAPCQGICGNGAVDAVGETCDGNDFAGEDCVSQGFDYGTLDCADDCTLDSSGCGDFSGDCCSDNGAASPGCDDDSCNAVVCAAMPSCCTGTWDAMCAALAATDCAACNPGVCGNNLVEGAEVCDGIDLDGQDCASQGFDFGAIACEGDCSAFDTASCNDFGDCDEDNIGSVVGNGVASGSLVGEDEDLAQNCGNSGGVDRVIAWTAPAAGTYRFDTVDSDFDTVLSLHHNCGASPFLCNDDLGFNANRDSRIVTTVAAGEVVLVAVAGYGGATGNYILNINLDVPGTGDCCVPHGTYSCDSEAGCAATVCAVDANCCNVAGPWSQGCVDIAETSCASCM